MGSTKAKLSRLSELTSGQKADFFALLADKTRDVTSAGKPYYRCRFRDAQRTVTFMVWGDDAQWFEACERDWHVGHFYKLRATYHEHEKYGPQLEKLHNLRPINDADRADGFDESHFVERSRQDVPAMLTELRTLAAKHIHDAALRQLVLTLLERHAEPFSRLPALRDRAYPFVGGLLEHTLAVTRVAIDLAERYASYYTELKPPLNRELVAAAAILHDLGRVREVGEEPAPALPTVAGVSVAGRLLGHLLLGRDMVHEVGREQGVSPELLQLLEHILLTYHAPDLAGLPRQAMVPEALILHHAEELDLKMEMFVRTLTRDQAAGPFTDYAPALGRQLLKGRTV
jgi:3'-5' exoribonuclease